MAGRVYFYVITALILTMLVSLAGFNTSTDGDILSQTGLDGFESGNLGNFDSGDLFQNLFGDGVGILAGIAALGAIVVTFFAKSPSENYVLLPLIIGTLTLFLGALWKIMIIAQGYPIIAIPVILIMGPFTVGYIITMVEFFRGNV